MSLDRPGGDEQDDEFIKVLDSAAAPRRPGFSGVRAMVRLRTAGGMVGPVAA